MKLERIALEDEGVKAQVAKLKLPEGSVVIADPWIYGKLAYSIPYKEIFLIELLNRIGRYQR